MVDELEVDRGQEELRTRMEESREALAQKIELLEEKVTETVETATASVAEATASVLETMQNATASVSETVDTVTTAVQGTMDTVRLSVEGTVDSVRHAVDLPLQVRKHPWLMLAGAVAAGYLGGTLLQRASQRQSTSRATKDIASAESSPSSIREWQRAPFVAAQETSTNGFHKNESSTHGAVKSDTFSPSEPSNPASHPASHAGSSDWLETLGQTFAPELAKLKGLALGTLLGSVRDMVVKASPQPIQQSLAELMDDFTEKIGGQCIQGSPLSYSGTRSAPNHTTPAPSSVFEE